MPIYEYRCEPCEHPFEALMRNEGDVARCPECGGSEVVKQFSVPAAAQAGGGRSDSLPVRGPMPGPMPMGGCGMGGCGSGMCSLE